MRSILKRIYWGRVISALAVILAVSVGGPLLNKDLRLHEARCELKLEIQNSIEKGRQTAALAALSAAKPFLNPEKYGEYRYRLYQRRSAYNMLAQIGSSMYQQARDVNNYGFGRAKQYCLERTPLAIIYKAKEALDQMSVVNSKIYRATTLEEVQVLRNRFGLWKDVHEIQVSYLSSWRPPQE